MLPNNLKSNNILLTGFMGTGKSSVGPLLAAALQMNFVDTDDWIIDQTQSNISTLFARDGGTAFRQWETAAAGMLLTTAPLVGATGGGFFTNPLHIEMLTPKFTVFCLSCQTDELLQRLQGDQERPLLKGTDPVKMKALLAARAPLYSRFPKIDTSGKTPADVVALILQRLSR